MSNLLQLTETTAWDALREIMHVLGPNPTGCTENTCEGCRAEMDEALRIAKRTLGLLPTEDA